MESFSERVLVPSLLYICALSLSSFSLIDLFKEGAHIYTNG